MIARMLPIRDAVAGVLFLILPIFGSSALHAQESDAWKLLKGMQNDYERINDYVVDIRATMKMPGLSVPEMNATMYFRKPDKVHVESERFAMLPRDAVMFHPSMFKPEEYDALSQGDAMIRGTNCRKIKLLAKSDTVRLQRVQLYVDPVKREILRMETDPGEAASASADFTYLRSAGHTMPATITIEMKSPMAMRRSGVKPRADKEEKAEPARIALTYSNYRINKGIPDAVFSKKTTQK
jgi:hypothetical protein